MSDVKVNDVEDDKKNEKEIITSDESRDEDTDGGTNAAPVKEKSPKKEAPKTPKKEKQKPANRKTPSKRNVKKESEDEKGSDSDDSVKKGDDQEDDKDGDDDEDDDDDEKDEANEKKPLLDQPLEMHGARERKKVERLAISFNVPTKDKKLGIPDGEGEKLGEIPIIEFRLQKYKSEELKFFHRVLFNRAGQATEIKKNIRRFSGFNFKADSEEYEKKKSHLDKGTLASLKQICEIIDVERSGTKEDIIGRMLDFLMMPKSTGKKVPTTKSKRTRSSSGRSRASTRKTKGKGTGRRSGRSKANADDSKSESSNVDEDEEEEEEEEEDEKSVEKNSEDSDEEIVKPSKRQAKSKTPAKKEENKKAEKKEAKKPAPKSSNKRKKGGSSDEESSDDEPLAKKTKPPPTNDELKALIEKILDGANLEETTMKTVCKQVYGTFPEFDLSDRKEFIKKTVKSIIS